MLESVRHNQKLLKAVMFCIMLPLMAMGVGPWLRDMVSADDSVAQIGSVKISNQQLSEAVRAQQQNLRQQLGDKFSQDDAESPAFRESVLNGLVDQQVIDLSIRSNRLAVPDVAIQNYILAMPDFQENGAFSKVKYEAVLRANNMSTDQFEYRVRSQLINQMLLAPIQQTALVPNISLHRILVLQAETRNVAEWLLKLDDYTGQVKLAEGAAKAYYDAHQADFRTPERIKAEYVVLSADAIASQIKLSDEEARKWYDEHKDKYQVPEERRASHILIKVDQAATQAQRDAAHKKAEEILAKAKANPASFADLAKQYSEDSVSAPNGGNLGMNARGAFAHQLDDTIFALKPHEISTVIETIDGYHVVMLDEVRAGSADSFDAVKSQVVAEATRDLANKRYAEASDQFVSKVYEQSDTFKPIAEQYGLKIEQTDWLARGQAGPGVMANNRVLEKLFGPDSLKDRRNIEAIDLGNGMLVSARVIDYQTAALQTFDQVKAQVEQRLIAIEAGKLAKADGEGRLAKLRAGEAVPAAWSVDKTVRRNTPELTYEAKKAIFGITSDKLPVYVGASTPTGYSIYRIDKIDVPTIADDDPTLAQARAVYANTLGILDGREYVAGLRQQIGVKINKAQADKNTSAAQ